MAATITRYNFTRPFAGVYAPIDDSGRMPLAWLIGDTLASLMLADTCAISQVRMQVGASYITVIRQRWRVSVFVSDCQYSRRIQ